MSSQSREGDILRGLQHELERLQGRNNNLALEVTALRDEKIASEKRSADEINNLRHTVHLFAQQRLDLEEALKLEPSLSHSRNLEDENRLLKIQVTELSEKIQRLKDDAQESAPSRSGTTSPLFLQLELQDQLVREKQIRIETEEKLKLIEMESEEELERVSHEKATISVELIAAKERIAALDSQLQHQNAASSSSQVEQLQQRLNEVTQERDSLMQQASIPSSANHDSCMGRLREAEVSLANARASEETLISRVATAEFHSKELQSELLAAQSLLTEREQQQTVLQHSLDRVTREKAQLLEQQQQAPQAVSVAEDVICAEIRSIIVDGMRHLNPDVVVADIAAVQLMQTYNSMLKDRLAQLTSSKEQALHDVRAQHTATLQELRLVQDRLQELASKAEEQQKLEVQLQNALAAQRDLWSKNHVLQEKLSTAEETISTNEALLPERISTAVGAAVAQVKEEYSEKLEAVENSQAQLKADFVKKLEQADSATARLRLEFATKLEATEDALQKANHELSRQSDNVEGIADSVRADFLAKLEEAQDRVTTLTRVNQGLMDNFSEEKARMLAEREELQQSIETLQAQNTELSNSVEQLRVRNGVCEREISVYEKSQLELKAQIAKLSEYDTDREAHESEKSNLRTELQHARQQLAKAELQLNRGSELAKETADLRENVKSLKRQLAEAQRSQVAAEAKLESSTASVAQLEARVESLVQSQQQLKAQLEAAAAKEKELNAKVKQAKEEAEEKNKQLQKDLKAAQAELQVFEAQKKLEAEAKTKLSKISAGRAAALSAESPATTPLKTTTTSAPLRARETTILSDASPVLGAGSRKEADAPLAEGTPSKIAKNAAATSATTKATPPSQEETAKRSGRAGRAKALKEVPNDTTNHPPKPQPTPEESSTPKKPLRGGRKAAAVEEEEDKDDDRPPKTKDNEKSSKSVTKEIAKLPTPSAAAAAAADAEETDDQQVEPKMAKPAARGKKKEQEEEQEREMETEKNKEKEQPVKERAKDTKEKEEKEKEKEGDAEDTPKETSKETPTKKRLSLGLAKKPAATDATSPARTETADKRPAKQLKQGAEVSSLSSTEGRSSRRTTPATPASAVSTESSPTPSPYVIAFSGFKDHALRDRLVKGLRAIPSVEVIQEMAEFDWRVTHIVAQPGLRTMKTIAASLTSRWLMIPAWCEACARAKRILPEESYGFKSDPSKNPFRGKKFFIHSSISSDTGCSVEQCENIFKRLGGGTIVSDLADADVAVVSKARQIPPGANTTDDSKLPRWIPWPSILESIPHPPTGKAEKGETAAAAAAAAAAPIPTAATAGVPSDDSAAKKKRGVQFAEGNADALSNGKKAKTTATPAADSAKKKK